MTRTLKTFAALFLAALPLANANAAEVAGNPKVLLAEASKAPKKGMASRGNWQSMMTIAERKRDAEGKLLPLQPYGETIRRGMSFLLDDHLEWFKGPRESLTDEQGNTQMPWVYYSNLQQDGTPFGGAVDGFVSYPAFHHALLIRTFIGYSKYANDQRPLKEAVPLRSR